MGRSANDTFADTAGLLAASPPIEQMTIVSTRVKVEWRFVGSRIEVVLSELITRYALIARTCKSSRRVGCSAADY